MHRPNRPTLSPLTIPVPHISPETSAMGATHVPGSYQNKPFPAMRPIGFRTGHAARAAARLPHTPDIVDGITTSPTNLPSPALPRPKTPEAVDNIPLTPPSQYLRPAPPARQPWNPADPNPDWWAKPVHGQRFVRDKQRRGQNTRGQDLENQATLQAVKESRGDKWYLPPRKTKLVLWSAALVVCVVVVAVAFTAAHFASHVG
ncbi:hypothetical protein OEA41_002891 [Lepraria neglecta]|uniref:Uncharacterized protein n=1 Tax=Lepraria neglecta TaxID=209136 RepID=A0AAD9Z616_9LECA|nr:hypothetical protein OEA41_002891 [Lepraria neglecta]